MKKEQQNHPSIATLNSLEANYQLLSRKALMTTAPKTEDVDYKEQFAIWLKSQQTSPFIHRCKYYCSVIIRVARNKDFDYLYSQQIYQTIQNDNDFRYAGIYCKANGIIYDPQYSIAVLLGNLEYGSIDLLEEIPSYKAGPAG